MGWGEQHDTPLIGGGTTGEMSLAQDALAAVGIKKPNLALAAIEAAGVIDRLRVELKRADKAFAKLYDETRCPDPGCCEQVGHKGLHSAWVAD